MANLKRMASALKKQSERDELIASFDEKTVASFREWTFGQFAKWFNPSPDRINAFVNDVMVDFHRDYNMPVDIEWHDLVNHWELSEPFMDCFGD